MSASSNSRRPLPARVADLIPPSAEEDAAITAAAESDPDAPPLTDQDFARMRPSAEAAPDSVAAATAAAKRARGQRGPQKAPTKEAIKLRLSPDVLAGFRATGPGWQTRIDEALREHLERTRA